MLAGCTGPPLVEHRPPEVPDPADGPGLAPASGGNATDPAAPAPAAPLEPVGQLRIETAGCVGARSFVLLPAAVAPGEPVPGWPEAPPTAIELGLHMVQCERLRWGPFERPMTLLLEVHDNQTPHDSCNSFRPGVNSVITVLHALWLSDPEVAAWANATFGMPTRAATFEVTRQDAGGITETAWSWTTPGGERSQVVLRNGHADEVPVLQTVRAAWKGAGLLHIMDFEETWSLDRAQASLTPGTMGPTMLYRQAGPEAYLGTGDAAGTVGVVADIWRFEDMACEHPV